MDQTPRLRSAFPSTPQTARRPPRFNNGSPALQTRNKPAPSTAAINSSSAPLSDPLIPERIVDAPTQRLFAFSCFVALWSWRIYDYSMLTDAEEQSLWLFMKWVAIDGVFLFGLPGLRIPWLEWSPSTMTLLFCAHAVANGMLMFRIPLPIAAGLAAIGRGIWGARELALNEHNVNPESIRFNDSLILGRQVIHILPEGSAVLNPEKEAFCIDGTRTEARLPIMINATNPIAMDILRTDLETQANETIHISKSQIKTMHKEASRLLTYSEDPNEPRILYYTTKKPGLYVLSKVVDESNLEVARKRLAHTVVASCPKAVVKPSQPYRCRGELSNVEFEVTGAPPISIKYRKTINRVVHDGTIENILPSEDFDSPLARQGQNALIVPNKVDTSWARSQKTSIAVGESLASAGRWVYSIDEVRDAFGNVVTYSNRDHEDQERLVTKSSHLHQIITVHERPTVSLHGCTPQQPLKVANGNRAKLPLRYGSTGKGGALETAYHLNIMFSTQEDATATGGHPRDAQRKQMTMKYPKELPSIVDAGLYTITGVSTDYCEGEVLEPASCILQNPPQPQLSLHKEEMYDKCAGSPIGLRVDLDLIGTPPFEILYRMTMKGAKHHTVEIERVSGLRGQIELTPKQAGHYTYDFLSISDAVYKNQDLRGISLDQNVKPSASARFVTSGERKVACIDDAVSFPVTLSGESPFTVEYELIHGGRRAKYTISDIHQERIEITTEPLKEGGDYTLALASVTDRVGCKEFLKDEVKVNVRHQRPKVGFKAVDGRRTISAFEGSKVQLPLRLEGDAPWTIQYLDTTGRVQSKTVRDPNDLITTSEAGKIELQDVRDGTCPGSVDDTAKDFEVLWIPRPEFRIRDTDIVTRRDNLLVKGEVCEGDEDGVEVLFKGLPPFHAHYTQTAKLVHGTMAAKNKDLRAPLNMAVLRMDTSQAGTYDYKFDKLADANYDHSPKHFAPLTVQQKVNARPSAAFSNPGKTYSYCSVESDGEEVIAITLVGKAPFDVEYEIKHFGTARPEIVSLTGITSNHHDIRIPHSRLHLGKSAISLRRVSDSNGCARTLDSTTPRVQISVHDAPTITALESQIDYCVGDRLSFALSGVAPFYIYYNFEGASLKASASSATFRRLAEKPGQFTITGVTDSASTCRSQVDITKHVHGLPSARVSKGRDSYIDIHEGAEAEILFEFGGVPPFEFTYTRSSNTEKGGKKPGVVLDMKSEVSEDYSLHVKAHEEGTYEVVSIKDRYCAYAKPGIKVDGKAAQKKLTY